MGQILTFDVGTTSMKCILFSEKFEEVFYENVEYSLQTEAGGIAELDAETYFDGFCQCLVSMRQKGADLHEISAICFTTQGETLIPVDMQGEPLCPAIVWLDSRASQEAELIKKGISQEEMYATTGLCEIDGALPMAKVLWMKKNKPELYNRVYKFLLLEDYLIFRLIGRFVSEKSLQSSTGWYNIIHEEFFAKILELGDVARDKFPEVLPCGTAVGNVSKITSEELGLSPKTVIVSGAMDQVASAIGAGNICEGMVTETTGTALVLGATISKPKFSLDTPVTIYKHYDNKYIYMPYSATAGIVLKWFRDTLMPQVKKQAKEKQTSSYRLLDELAESAPPGSHGVILNPDFSNGGAFYGLTLSTSAADIARSVLEGIAYNLRELVESLEKQGICIREILSLGGGSYSPLWGGIKASVCGKQITSVCYNQTTALGAAVLAAVAIGMYENVEQAVNMIQMKGSIYLPDKNEQEVYKKGYIKYKRYIKNGGIEL